MRVWESGRGGGDREGEYGDVVVYIYTNHIAQRTHATKTGTVTMTVTHAAVMQGPLSHF